MRLTDAGWLPQWRSIAEFRPAQNPSWLDAASDFGLAPVGQHEQADVVLDLFALSREPDLQLALAERISRIAPGGVLAIVFTSIEHAVRSRQWNVLRHNQFAYPSLQTLAHLLASRGLTPITAIEFDQSEGTTLVVAAHGGMPDEQVRAILAREDSAGVSMPEVLQTLEAQAELDSTELALALADAQRDGMAVYGYGADPHSLAWLARAGIGADLLRGVADPLSARWNTYLPGTAVPVLSPAELVAAKPDLVLLLEPGLLTTLRSELPALNGRWWVHRASGWIDRPPLTGSTAS